MLASLHVEITKFSYSLYYILFMKSYTNFSSQLYERCILPMFHLFVIWKETHDI